jgi:hypothetical protein
MPGKHCQRLDWKEGGHKAACRPLARGDRVRIVAGNKINHSIVNSYGVLSRTPKADTKVWGLRLDGGCLFKINQANLLRIPGDKSAVLSAPASTASTTVSETDILSACREQNFELLTRWRAEGVRVLTAEPLNNACVFGNLDVARILIGLGADVNRAFGDATPLIIAAMHGHLDIARLLVGKGADVNEAQSMKEGSKYGSTLLIIAVEHGCLPMVRCLIELGADVKQASERGFTPLMAAAQFNDQALIKHLVHKGAVVRAVLEGFSAITLIRKAGATAAQIAYLEVRECCANPGCDGGGFKRCAVCKETRYCGMPCRIAHWRVHRVDCRHHTGIDH